MQITLFSLIVVTLNLFHNYFVKRIHPILYGTIVGVSLLLSWSLIVAWVVTINELWDVSYWKVLDIDSVWLGLRRLFQLIFSDPPFSRIELAVLYTAPILLVSLFVLIIVSRHGHATRYCLRVALLCIGFFWLQVLIEQWAHASSSPNSGINQTLILIITYLGLLYLLLLPSWNGNSHWSIIKQ